MSEDCWELFETAFGHEPDVTKFISLLDILGNKDVTQALEYLQIFPPKLKEGKNNNPYGLIFYMIKNENYWKSNYSESSNND
jgi:hypothetical protein